MKILKIRLQNLNSLKGDHEIDLTKEPLASSGIFAITGPTGAGKTTLLDALTLALYGKVARYGNESNPENVMTRHCGECSAEVEFQVPSGKYRAVWQRRRARNKTDGKMQAAKRYLYDEAGQPIAAQIRAVEEKIEKLLGLNYDRFLRSALLAQGDFAKFLKAKADERAELLESLTGTAIYSRLGKLAREEANRKEEELRDKEAEIERIPVLEKEEREVLEKEIKKGDQKLEKLKKQIAKDDKMLIKINALCDARTKESTSKDVLAAVKQAREEAKDDLEKLRLHKRTSPFTDTLVRLEDAQEASTETTQKHKQATTAHAEATQALAQANHTLRAAINAELSECQQQSKDAGKALDEQTSKAAAARDWLNKHRNDASLTEQIGDLVSAIGDLKSARTSMTRTWTKWQASAAEILAEAADKLPGKPDSTSEAELQAAMKDFLHEAAGKEDTLKAAQQKAQKQHKLRKDHLDKTRLIASMADHRHTLEEGKECPLCGALDHPWAEDGAPDSELRELEDELEKANEEWDEAKDTYREFSRTLEALTNDQDDLLEQMRDAEANGNKLAELLGPLEAEVPQAGEEDTLQTELQERARAYRKHVQAETDAKGLKEQAERNAKQAKKDTDKLEKKINKLPPLPEDAGIKPVDPDDLPTVADAEETYSEAVSAENTTRNQAKDRKEDAEQARGKLKNIKQTLAASLAESEFETLDQLQAARLETDDAQELKELQEGLKSRENGATALLKQAKMDIGKLVADKVLEGDKAEQFTDGLAEIKEERDELLQELTTRKNQLKTDDKNLKLRADKEAELKDDFDRLKVWRLLRDLIGSHDGSKFRRHAQTISLAILSRHANRHLALLSDRYKICADKEDKLNLQIEDHYQADTRRPMASLSGGESFLVSLSLALGLSDLAGRTVRIDSLFIDEGFGTLDPETLEVAISALESLRQNDKTVGVISHVALLKERISTQIAVEKKPGGISSINITTA